MSLSPASSRSAVTPAVSSGHPARPTLTQRFQQVRGQSMAIAAYLTPEDMTAQSMADASPTKWQLAHTTWFFERFVLRQFITGYCPRHETYEYLFNSYYNTVGPQHCRPRRGIVTRPGVQEISAYRQHVDEHVLALLASESDNPELQAVMEVGLNHEQQHQELMITDIKHLFSCNPLLPAMLKADENESAVNVLPDTAWRPFQGGVVTIGGDPADGFKFDNELPRHRVFLEPFAIAHRPVSNGEYLRFIEQGGYQHHQFWLSMGWATLQSEKWTHPIYWYQQDGRWRQYTLSGPADLRLDEPVCHLSYFEADAYARWAGVRLPTEFEWEHAAADQPLDGVCASEMRFHPAPLDPRETHPTRFFGDVWEWTSSSYAPYPDFQTPPGALGEYNGKFMCNQYVLRGGSCATPPSQTRLTYRNFFGPEARWQFAGLRLARSV